MSRKLSGTPESLRRSEKAAARDDFLITVGKVPSHDFWVLRATNNSSRVKLEFEYSGVGLGSRGGRMVICYGL